MSRSHLFVLPAAVLVVLAAPGPIRDNSFLWHIRAGELQLEAGEVIRTDPFSFSRFGEAWRTQSWLAELGYGWLERATGGVGWTPVMVAILGLMMAGFVGLAIYSRTRRVVPMAIGLTLLALGFLFFSVPRPVLVSFVLLAVLMVVLGNGAALDWTLVPLLWVWASLHGSWVIAIAVIGLEVVRRMSLRLAVSGAVGLVATLLTPHGIEGWRFALELSTNREALAYLSEWQPPDFAQPVLWPFLAVVAGLLVAAVRGKFVLRDLVLVIPVLVLGLMQERTVFVALVVLLPYAAMVFDERADRTEVGRPALNWLIAGLVIAGTLAVFIAEPTRLSSRFPVALVDRIETEHVFAGVRVGGYLIYAEGPQRLVYVDDRAELYGASGFEEFTEATDGVGYEDVFAAWGITEAIVENDWPLRLDLERDGWRSVADEGEYVLMRAP